jgi:hypothetical protein
METVSATVSSAARDIVCSNGVVHVIDHVLVPRGIVPPAAPTTGLSTGAIVGIAAGGAVVLGALAWLARPAHSVR